MPLSSPKCLPLVRATAIFSSASAQPFSAGKPMAYQVATEQHWVGGQCYYIKIDFRSWKDTLVINNTDYSHSSN